MSAHHYSATTLNARHVNFVFIISAWVQLEETNTFQLSDQDRVSTVNMLDGFANML